MSDFPKTLAAGIDMSIGVTVYLLACAAGALLLGTIARRRHATETRRFDARRERRLTFPKQLRQPLFETQGKPLIHGED